MARQSINDSDREDWVQNDEGLYNMMRRSGQGMRRFVRENRATIDECIVNVTESKRPAHYMAYGG
jgi:hypothetical protein